MLQKLKGVKLGFLRKVTGMKDKRLGEEIRQKYGAYRVIQEAGTKPLREYINKSQATVVEWVSLQPISKVCARETGY